MARFGIGSMLDVGCGEGHSTRFFQQLGCRVLGVDGCQLAIADSLVPECVQLHDFTTGPFVPRESFDLVWSCEFLEHVAAEFEANVLATFSQAKKAILLTHAFPGQKGHNHVNCQPNSYWIRRIEALGFSCQVADARAGRTVTLQDYPSVNHFARSGLIFVRTAVPAQRQTVWSTLAASVSSHIKAVRINSGFRRSRVFRSHVAQRKLAKRLAKRLQANLA